jgi:heat shock protein HtpX
MRTVRVPVLLAPIALVVAVVVGLVFFAFTPWIVALIVGVVAGLSAAFALYARAERAVIGSLTLRPVDEDDEPRLQNMIDGLCDSHGFHRPTLAIIDDPALNAVVFGRRPDHATLALTTGLRDALTRMELEGLLARELALATHPALPGATVLVPVLALLPTGLRGPVANWYVGEHRSLLDDFDAVRFTRYPPGLAAALDKLAAASTVVAGAGRTSGHLWVAPPLATGSTATDQPTIDARAAALREL